MRNDKARNSNLLDGGKAGRDVPERNEFPDGGLGELFSDGTEDAEQSEVQDAEPASESVRRPRSEKADEGVGAENIGALRARRKYMPVLEPEEEPEYVEGSPAVKIEPNPMMYQPMGYRIEKKRHTPTAAREQQDMARAQDTREDVPATRFKRAARSGATLDSRVGVKVCPACGSEIGDKHKFCPECGASLSGAERVRSISGGRGAYAYNTIDRPEAQYAVFKQLMIVVHSPKGGVGKSTLSKELAQAFASAEVNGRKLKVLIVDADWENGDIATLFNVPSTPNVIDWVRRMHEDHDEYGEYPLYEPKEIVNSYMRHYGEGKNLDILAGTDSSVESSLVDEEVVACMMDNLRHCEYDVILIDSCNSTMERTIVPILKADYLCLVETLDTSTLFETSTFLTTLRDRQFDVTSKVKMILNEVPTNDKEHDIPPGEIERILQIPISAIIPQDSNVRMANNAAESLVIGKETPYAKAIKKAANAFYPVFIEEKKSGGFFGRLFGRKKK